MPRVIRGYKGDGCFLMGEVPLYGPLEGLNHGVRQAALGALEKRSLVRLSAECRPLQGHFAHKKQPPP